MLVLLVLTLLITEVVWGLQPLNRIAFGSCNRQFLPQQHWEKISGLHPDLWIWGGDIVYADKMVFPFIFSEASEESLRASYEKQKSNPYYQAFLQQVPVIGVWVKFFSSLLSLLV